jgi:shikimate kinase
VIWIGGGCGAGKSTLARRLAYRLDLRLYPVDAYMYAHLARATPERHPIHVSMTQRDFAAAFVDPTVEERVQTFIDSSVERLDLVGEDLAALADGPTVIAEGPALLPDLVYPHLATPDHGVWLIPTPEFTARTLDIRAEPRPTTDEAAIERAHRLRLARDERLAELIRDGAHRLGLMTLDADLSLSIEESERRLADALAPAIARARPARDGSERARIRHAENVVVNRQIDGFHEYLGDAKPKDLPPFPYVCECTTLGCAAAVPLHRAEYDAAGRAVAPGHPVP